MSGNSIGGFFVNLGMNVDKHSFETGNKLIDGIGNGLNKITGLARNAAVVLAATTIASGAASSAELKTAAAMGIAAEKLDMWRAAASIAGVKSSSLIASMGQLASVMNHTTIDGSGLEKYAEKLSFLKMNVADLLKMDPADAYKTILGTALEEVKNDPEQKVRITTIVGDVLGSDGRDFFSELVRKNIGIDDFLSGAAATQYQTTESKNKGADFMNEFNTTLQTLKSLTQLFGNEIGGALTPAMKKLNAWLTEHGTEIATALTNAAAALGVIVDKLVPYVSTAIDNLDKGIEHITNVIKNPDSIIEQNKKHKEIQKQIDDYSIEKYGKNLLGLPKKIIPIEELPIDLQDKINSSPLGASSFRGLKINDGIIRPNGQVTQVAPDDWVFAARNIGDLASAFIPQGMANAVTNNNSSKNQYSIVQNFTINGARDMPQTVRQQAYRGTQSALLESLQQGGSRLQQMSGIR